MSNQDRAAEVIRTWQQRHKGIMDSNPDWAAQNLAGDLNQAGLLAPDLPEPSYIVTECEYEYPVWECGSRYSIEEETPGYITIFDEGEPAESLTLQEARKVAHALLAAADYAEGNRG